MPLPETELLSNDTVLVVAALTVMPETVFSISPNDRITEVVPAVKVSVLVVWSNHLRVVTEGVLVEPSE